MSVTFVFWLHVVFHVVYVVFHGIKLSQESLVSRLFFAEFFINNYLLSNASGEWVHSHAQVSNTSSLGVSKKWMSR